MALATQAQAARLSRPSSLIRPAAAAARCAAAGRRVRCRQPWRVAAAEQGSTTRLADRPPLQQQDGAEAPSAGPSSSSAGVDDSFVWTRHWWPVQVADCADPSRPHAVELLGMQLVLWRDGTGRWQVFEDACPHRLAPLSEGRLEADGTLQCSYHGWRFDGSGRCTEIPQALDDKAKAVACSSSRSCVKSFPTREAYGLIWCFPDSSSDAQAAADAAPLPVAAGLASVWDAGKRPTTYRRELPYSYDVLVENLADPSHLPFSHHRLTPALRRSAAKAMPFTRVEPAAAGGGTAAEPEAVPGWSMEHTRPLAAFQFPSVMSPRGVVAFTPPAHVVYQYASGEFTLGTYLIAVPAGPGRSVSYTTSTGNVATVTAAGLLRALLTAPAQLPRLLLRYAFQRRPAWRVHQSMNKLFDQDSVFLNMQDRQLALRGSSSWQQGYYMPTPCDGLVVAARRWMEAALQQPLRAGDTHGARAADAISLSAVAAAASPRLP